jgi:NADH:ubiquinone oxidoreductase subunit 5 (subunit L)/multisubunit Na+/H+ antiporter MnhA subunit
MVLNGSPSAHLRQVATSGGHLDDGVTPMRVACGVLALMIVGAGLGGPWLETVLHHAFASDASLGLLAGTAGAETDGAAHGLVPILSVVFVLAGAAPAYYVYIARRASPQAWLNASPLLRSVHAFLWNRWSIDELYTRVFVDGFARAARRVAEVEASLDRVVHQQLPWLFTGQVERIVHRLRADTEELFYNVSYVLVLFGLLLMFLFLGTGG